MEVCNTMPDIFSTDALAAEVKKLPDLPKNEGKVGAVMVNGDAGVEGSISADLGKGVFVEGEGSWFMRAGYRAAAMIGWKKK